MRSILGTTLATFIVLQAGAEAADPVGTKLTPKLKELLANEMQQVDEATAELTRAIAGGDHARVMKLGVAIRDSFILKRSLTEQDKKDLMSVVPPEFVALDGYFHGTAGKLAHAAEIKDSELQGFYFYRMLETCVTCHTRFASDRFPGLGEEHADRHEH